eukprot:175148-Pyramimonas_sp.AAC.1
MNDGMRWRDGAVGFPVAMLSLMMARSLNCIAFRGDAPWITSTSISVSTAKTDSIETRKRSIVRSALLSAAPRVGTKEHTSNIAASLKSSRQKGSEQLARPASDLLACRSCG